MKARRQRDAAEQFTRHVTIAATVLLVSFVCSGCGKAGPRNCRISGAVTLDGVPVQEGGIQFDIVKKGDVPGGAGGDAGDGVPPGKEGLEEEG